MEETTPYDSLVEEQVDPIAQGYQELYDSYNKTTSFFDEQKAALNSTTLLTALARTDETRSIPDQLGADALSSARSALEAGEEYAIRVGLARKRAEKTATGLAKLRSDMSKVTAVPVPDGAYKAIDAAYSKALSQTWENKAKSSIEEEAIDRIRAMASTDPVQAKVQLDLLDKGDAFESHRQFNVKLQMLRQRAEELDEHYQQSGWGRFALNMVLNLIPTNFNFQRTGVVGTAGIGDLVAVGGSLREQSENLWGMPLEEFAEFAAKDGPLMQSIKDNATSPFDMIDDPGAAVEIMNSLIDQSDSGRKWNNIWGGVEIASAVPWGKVATTTRSLVSNGAVKEATRNLANAAEVLSTSGPEVMAKATGVTEKELVDELSVTAVKGTDDGVPLAEPVAAHREAAQQAINDLFNPVSGNRFNTTEEAGAAVEGFIDEMKGKIGRPVKDVNIKTSPHSLPGGQTVTRVEMLVGKKDGFGFATEGMAARASREMGFGDEIAEVVDSTEKPLRPKEVTLTQESKVTGGDGLASYRYTMKTADGDSVPLSLTVEEGRGYLEIGGMSTNQVGPAEMRRIGAQLADEIPELKTIEGIRTTGARKEAGNGASDSVVSFDVEKLRGKTEVVRDMSGQYFIKVVRDMPETGWYSGKLQPEQQGIVSRLAGRFIQSAARITDPMLHGRAIEAGSYLNRNLRVINKDMMDVFRRLPGKSKEIVKELLHNQQVYERWYTPAEIDFMTERALGRRATEAEQAAMADYRLYDDMEWELRNTDRYLENIMQGKESVKFRTKWGQELDEDVKIDYTMEKIPTDRVYDASRHKHFTHQNPLTTKELAKLKNRGFVMMRFSNAFELPNGVKVNNVLIRKSDVEIRALRENQLAYSPGGHRMYTDRYFVKQGRMGKQPDTGSEYQLSPNTFRTAENIAEARKWADKMNEARLAVKENPGMTSVELDELFGQQKMFPTGDEFLKGLEDGAFNLDHPFEALFDRELPSMYTRSGEDVTRLFNDDELGINGYYRTTGKMYTSSKGDILYNVKGEVADILDPYDTMVTSLQQITRKNGLFDYKQNALERFENTYKQWLARDPGQTGRFSLLDSDVVPGTPVEMRNQIKAQQDAIKNVLRFEPPAEKMGRQIYQRIAEAALGDGENVARKAAHDAVWWFKDHNPLAIARGLAFDSKLGMYNIGQLLVQSSTMFSALALSPKHGLAGMAGLFPMHAYLLKGGSEAVLDSFAKKGVWKAMNFGSPDEFKDFARHMYRSGFLEMNGQHIMINSYGPAAHFGSFAEKASRVREHSRVFFYTAETWNRIVAYRIAWGQTIDKGIKPIDKLFDLNVLKEADDYSFNMTNESAAYWQKGILSIPTQFWAYNQRMFDAMFGSRFTGAQRARLIGMNLAIAGSAGVPGLQALSEYIKTKHGSAPDLDSLQGLADRGVVDYLNYKATGNDILIGERVGTGGWASQVVRSAFGNSQYGDVSTAEMLGGATFNIGLSMSKTVHNLVKYAVAESGGDLDGGELTKEGFVQMLKEVSTFGNASKAMMIHQYGLYKSNKGTIIADELPEGNAVYAALSFRPAKADQINYMMGWKKNKEDAIKEVSGKLRSWRQEALTTGDWETNYKKANALVRLLPEADRAEVLRRTNAVTDQSFYDYVERKVSEEQMKEEGTEE